MTENIFKNKTILITGAGTVGREIAKQLLEFKPYSIRLFDNSEHSLWEAKQMFPDRSRLRFLLGDVTSYDRIDMATWSVDYVFFTSAQKHIEFGQYSPFQSINSNIMGAENIIKACLKNERVKKICNTSTDKVVNPTSLYGRTKAISEYLFNWASKISLSKQTFYNVRFCNIMGSRGSVIPIWKTQISENYITITDERMERYMISVEDACRFIIGSMEFATPHNIYIPKKGMRLYKINDLAKEFVESQNKRLEDMEIRIIGKSDGERLFENLWSEEEEEKLTNMGDYWVINNG